MPATSAASGGKRSAKNAEWLQYKDFIENLYIKNNLSLEAVMKVMAEKHGFKRSKAQYEGILKKWGFRKNMSKDGWKNVLHQVQKRASQNKPSMVKVGGHVRTEKSIAKARQRYSYQTFAERLNTCKEKEASTPSDTLEAIVVTPPPSTASPLTLPWFRFYSFFTSKVQSSTARTSMGSTERPSISTSVPLESSSGTNSFCPYNHFTTNYNRSKYQAEIRQLSSFLPCGPDENGRMLRIDSMDPYIEFLIAMYSLSNNIGLDPIYSNTFHVRLLEICRSKDGLAFLRVLLASQERTIMAAAEKLLILTVSSNDERLTRVLLNAGVSPDAISFLEDSILKIAVKKKYKNLVSLLMGVSTQVYPSSLLLDALHDDYDIEIVKLVLDYFVLDDEVAPLIEIFLEALDYGKIRWSVELVDILLSYFLRLTWIDSKKVVTSLFLVAVGIGEQELVRRLLSLGADINFAKPRRPTGLESAVRMDDVSMVELLVSHGADPNRTQHNVELLPTALQIAAERGNLCLVRFLLNNGANVNAAPFDEIFQHEYKIHWNDNVNIHIHLKTTTLQCGVKGRNFAVVKALIDAGASLAESDGGNILQTALQIACQESSYEMIHLLLSNGAKVNAESKSLRIWQTPLTSALKFKREHIIEFLLENGADINVPSKDSRFPSPLQICVELGEIDMVKRFLDLGAHAFDSGALWAATSIGNLDIIYLLLQHNKNSMGFAGEVSEIKSKDYGRAAICTAIKDRKHDASHLLLDAGVDVTRPPEKSFFACFSKLPRLRESPRCAPLAAALSLMDINWVRTLLEAGADVNVCRGEEFFDYDCAFDHLNLTSSNIEAMVELLCANGALINCCKAVCPPLQCAVEANLPGIVRLFLSKGADINLMPHSSKTRRRTALQLAVELNLGDIVEILIGSNADVDASPAEHRGATAIQFAAINGNFKILQLLLTAGANLFACRGRLEGRTALEGAAEHGRLDMVQFILMKSTEMEGLYFEHQFCRAIKFARMGGHISLSEMIRSHQIERYGSSECRGHETVFVFKLHRRLYQEKRLQIGAIDPSRDFDDRVYDEEFDQALFDSLSVVSSDDSEDLESERQEPNSITSPSGFVNHQESVMPGQVMNNQESSTEMDYVDYHNPWYPEFPYEQGYQHGYDEMLMIPPFDSDQIVPETTSPGFIIEELFEFNV